MIFEPVELDNYICRDTKVASIGYCYFVATKPMLNETTLKHYEQNHIEPFCTTYILISL